MRTGAARPRAATAHSVCHGVLTCTPFNPSRLCVRRDAPLETRVVLEQRVEKMVLPQTVDAQIAARQPLPLEAEILKQLPGGLVVRQARRLQPVQAQLSTTVAPPNRSPIAS